VNSKFVQKSFNVSKFKYFKLKNILKHIRKPVTPTIIKILNLYIYQRKNYLLSLTKIPVITSIYPKN